MAATGIILFAAFCFYLVGGWASQGYKRIEEKHKINQDFHVLLSSISIGAGLEEVEATLGRPADKTRETQGVLNNPHDLREGKAAEGLGPLVDYELHEWYRGDCVGVVVYNKEKIVEGKWVYGGGYGNRGSRRIPKKPKRSRKKPD